MKKTKKHRMSYSRRAGIELSWLKKNWLKKKETEQKRQYSEPPWRQLSEEKVSKDWLKRLTYGKRAVDRWRLLRYEVLKENGGSCAACKATDKPLHVDHVKPKYLYPHLEFEKSNLQVLCEDCNLGKGAWDETDWRSV